MSIIRFCAILMIMNICFAGIALGGQTVRISANSAGRMFEGIGALSAGASSRLLIDYSEPYRSQILDILFKPKFGASLHQLKVEIGGDVNSTDGSEPSHARTRKEFENPQPEYYNRGYEWWLMEEAIRRNPQIILDCLEWGCPGWIGNGVFFSKDNADYISLFIKKALEYHNLKIDYTGIWNERDYDKEWIKLLRRTLDRNGLKNVKIIAADVFDWKLADEMAADPELNDAIHALGIHYNERWKENRYGSTSQARSLNKSLRNSEGGPWKGDWEAFAYLVKMYNRSYISGKLTNFITWSLISSYYDYLELPNSGLMTANSPWSGYFDIQPAIWAVAHTTQFVDPGWYYLDDGCGYLSVGGSFVTLKNSLNSEFSIIIETMDTSRTQPVTFIFDDNFKCERLAVWRSIKNKESFVRLSDIEVINNQFSIELIGNSVYSITNTTGQQKGTYIPPVAQDFPLPYSTDFENESLGRLPEYFSDQAGIFEVSVRSDGKGKCLKQVVTQQGIEWWRPGDVYVQSLIGDSAWTNYEIKVDISIPENTGQATLAGRITETARSILPPEGYRFKIATSGLWQLFAGEEIIARGRDSFKPFVWHNLIIKFIDDEITVRVNDKEIVNLKNDIYKHGAVGIGSVFNFAEFDNFSISPVAE
jgi:hypothetical protein